MNVFLIGLLGLAVAYLSYRLYWETLDQPGFERGKSIAVLPFTNIVAETEPDTAYFSEGVTEEILNALSMVKELRVAASRLVGIVDNKGMAGTEMLFDRVGWAAMAQLGLGNVSRARELFDIGIPDLAVLDPNPSSVRIRQYRPCFGTSTECN